MIKGTQNESAKGTLDYRTYSNKERKKMHKYLQSKGWSDLWHWNNWVKVEWIKDSKKDVDRMGSSLISVYLSEKKNEK